MKFRRILQTILISASVLALFSCNSMMDEAAEKNLSRLKWRVFWHPSMITGSDHNGRTALHDAALSGWEEGALFLLKHGADPNAKDKSGFSPLHLAVKNGHLELSNILVDAGADIESTTNFNHTPLHWAALMGRKPIAEWLIIKGADGTKVDRNGLTPAQLAREQGHPDTERLLHPLHQAIRMNGEADVENMLKTHPDLVKARDGQGRTPLHIAEYFDRRVFVDRLIGLGADRVAKDDYGLVPGEYSPTARRNQTGTNHLDPSLGEVLDDVVYRMIKKYDFINLALVMDGEIQYSRSYGVNELNGSHAWGSVSKPLTAIIIMKLLNEGRIRSLDDPIWEYSSRYAGSMPDSLAGTPITIRDLLLHRSGIPHNDQPTWRGDKLNLLFRPGSRFSYSTPGYGVLGNLIEDITGMSYSEAVHAMIGLPVNASSFQAQERFRSPGAGVLSTIEDMAKFAIGIIDEVYLPEHMQYDEVFQNYSGAYGLGWQCSNVRTDSLIVEHGGSNGVPQAYLWIQPKRGIAVCLQASAKDPSSFHLDGFVLTLVKTLQKWGRTTRNN